MSLAFKHVHAVMLPRKFESIRVYNASIRCNVYMVFIISKVMDLQVPVRVRVYEMTEKKNQKMLRKLDHWYRKVD